MTTGPRPAHPLEGQTSTRIDSDVTHSLVPTSPFRRSDGRAGTERFVGTRLSRGCIAEVVLHFDRSRRHPRSGRIGETCVRSGDAAEGDREVPLAAIRRRAGRSGDPAERDPAGESRFVRYGVGAGARDTRGAARHSRAAGGGA